jgi:hypothetical protein
MVRWIRLEAPRLGVLAAFAAILAALLLLALASPSLTLAASNPSGTGQPGAECGEENALVEPAGFLTDGFGHAEEMYAGSGASVDHAGSEHAVSQYDVACFQLSSR